MALFIVALRLTGNIMTNSKSEYVENFFKNGLLEALTIGWQRYGEVCDLSIQINKEIPWILSNMVASNSELITYAIVKNQFISERIKELLNPSINVDFSTRLEVLILVKNIVAGYRIDICYTLVYQNNLLAHLVPLLDSANVYQHQRIFREALEVVQ